MPRTIGGKSGLVRSGMRTPIEDDRLVFRPRAIELGRYPSADAASSTRSAVSDFTSDRVSGLSARDAVDGCTWARCATSRSVGVITRARYLRLHNSLQVCRNRSAGGYSGGKARVDQAGSTVPDRGDVDVAVEAAEAGAQIHHRAERGDVHLGR